MPKNKGHSRTIPHGIIPNTLQLNEFSEIFQSTEKHLTQYLCFLKLPLEKIFPNISKNIKS